MSTFPILQVAIWQERQLYLDYQRGNGTTVQRLVNPLGLVAKGSICYLVASVEGEVRSYRISRIHQATIADFPDLRPVGFDLAKYWQQSMVEFTTNLPRYAVRVRVAPEIMPRLRYGGYFARIEQVGAPDADGWMPVSLRFDIEEAACAYVLGFGAQMEVVEPIELRDRVLQAAKEAIAFHSSLQGRRISSPIAGDTFS